MKKIIFILGIIGAIGGIVLGVTNAYFIDTETSENNSLASGTFDIVTEGSWSNPYTFINMYPGETPREVNFTLRNKGSLPMKVWMTIKNVSNEENGISDSEQDWYTANGVKNDVDSVMVYALNVDGNLVLEQEAGITVSQIKDYYINLVNTETGNEGATLISDGILESGEDIVVSQKFYLPPITANWAQSDIMSFEIEILAQQVVAQEPIKQISFLQDEYHANYETDGIIGVLKYDSFAEKFNYEFIATGVNPGTEYNLLYYADGWPGNNPGYAIDYGNPDINGNLVLSGSVDIGMNLPHLDDGNYPYGSKIWCVASSHYDRTGKKITKWPLPQESLLSRWPTLINYTQSTDGNPYETKTVAFTDLGTDPQFGSIHDYSTASVNFDYDTPALSKLSGIITATGLKPSMTYQTKFIGKPTCTYGISGDNVANEYIGYKGRWTCLDCTCSGAGCNRTDAQYEANKVKLDADSSKECIGGYLAWDYITADNSGDVIKTIETANSYHVLFCSGGTCGQTSNSQLNIQSPYPICDENDVNGEIERFTCDGLILDSGDYDLEMVLTEESFHQSAYGVWTTVMSGDINFEIE